MATLLKNVPKLPDQDGFLLYLQNNAYSKQTIYNYARDLCILAVYLHTNKISFENMSKEDINNYKGYLREGRHLDALDQVREEFLTKEGEDLEKYKEDFLEDVYRKVYGSLGILDKPQNSRARSEGGLDGKSINRMLSALRSYLRYRINMELDIPFPPDAVNMIRTKKKAKKVASIEELVSLIESPMEFEKNEDVALRNRAMLEILFATGMRISELINLNLDQLNSDGKLYILGKGNKERAVFLTPRGLTWLNKYLKIRLEHAFTDRSKEEQPAELDKLTSDLEGNDGEKRYIKLVESYRRSGFLDRFDSKAVFIPFNGPNVNDENCRLSTNYFQERIADYRKRLGIQIQTSAHSLRHGFATYMAEKGANASALQVLLGHESLDTTTRYVHGSEKFAQETVEKYHPLK
ncbi:MAG: Tyrosine recombinase XerC [candidate division WS6 bacterium 34_10]|uniref:Tyrosine recombinase XerC n=1 Tax=candidate division WS6 bacterium 34_10 TaxID=1641389 RepID=A0A117LZZ4_9BACT|nr:MAG: Tyrosine recombinase XerC [candidate division WS6 bacterium 34_10]